jgi:hypothetical protein
MDKVLIDILVDGKGFRLLYENFRICQGQDIGLLEDRGCGCIFCICKHADAHFFDGKICRLGKCIGFCLGIEELCSNL